MLKLARKTPPSSRTPRARRVGRAPRSAAAALLLGLTTMASAEGPATQAYRTYVDAIATASSIHDLHSYMSESYQATMDQQFAQVADMGVDVRQLEAAMLQILRQGGGKLEQVNEIPSAAARILRIPRGTAMLEIVMVQNDQGHWVIQDEQLTKNAILPETLFPQPGDEK